MSSPTPSVPDQVFLSSVNPDGQVTRTGSTTSAGLSSTVKRGSSRSWCVCRRPGFNSSVWRGSNRHKPFFFYLFFIYFYFLRSCSYWLRSLPFERQGCKSWRGDVFRPAKHCRLPSRVPGFRSAPLTPRSADEDPFLFLFVT